MKGFKVVLTITATTILLFGCGGEEVDINGAAMDYEELELEIKNSESELEKVSADLQEKEKELAEIEKVFADKSEEYEDLEELSKNRDGVVAKVKDSEKSLGLLEADIESAQDQLDELNGDIIKTKDEPIKVSPGYYTIGDDIIPGRYKLMAQEGQRGNVFVREDGISKVAETFGGGEYGITDFTFQANMEDEIEATIPILLYPVE